MPISWPNRALLKQAHRTTKRADQSPKIKIKRHNFRDVSKLFITVSQSTTRTVERFCRIKYSGPRPRKCLTPKQHQTVGPQHLFLCLNNCYKHAKASRIVSPTTSNTFLGKHHVQGIYETVSNSQYSSENPITSYKTPYKPSHPKPDL